MKDFAGKTAFITGGAGGIGLGMARAFGRAGMNIVLADIDGPAAKAAAEGLASEQIKAVAVTCDVADRGGVRAAALGAIGAFGKVHVVCNNAGIAPSGLIGGMRGADWDWIIDVNLKGVVFGVETFAPLIASHGEGGHIVNTASIAGLISGPGMEAYSATKFAVVAMCEGWATQLAPQGIGMSVLCPGYVRTGILDFERSRPDRYGARPVKGEAREHLAAAVQAIDAGIDPDVVGERVVEAVRADEFYIITDPRWLAIVEMRFGAIRAGFEAAAASEVLRAVKTWPPMPAMG